MVITSREDSRLQRCWYLQAERVKDYRLLITDREGKNYRFMSQLQLIVCIYSSSG